MPAGASLCHRCESESSRHGAHLIVRMNGAHICAHYPTGNTHVCTSNWLTKLWYSIFGWLKAVYILPENLLPLCHQQWFALVAGYRSLICPDFHLLTASLPTVTDVAAIIIKSQPADLCPTAMDSSDGMLLKLKYKIGAAQVLNSID